MSVITLEIGQKLMTNTIKIINNDSTKRINRLLFLYHLKTEYGIIIRDSQNINALAKTWQVSTRTVKRDISDANKMKVS
jgi:hypothetical protein